MGIIEIGLELDNIDTFKKVVACIQSLPDVFSVKRIQTSAAFGVKPSNGKNTKKTKTNKKGKE